MFQQTSSDQESFFWKRLFVVCIKDLDQKESRSPRTSFVLILVRNKCSTLKMKHGGEARTMRSKIVERHQHQQPHTITIFFPELYPCVCMEKNYIHTKKDEHIECSCRRWLGLFPQQFSWAPPLLQTLKFHNIFFTRSV